MEPIACFCVFVAKGDEHRKRSMRKAILSAVGGMALASPAFADGFSEGPAYQREVPYEYQATPPVVIEQPVVGRPVVVRRPVVVVPPPVVVEEYPVYAAPRVYAGPPVYAYGGPLWRGQWGHRHFRGRW